MTFELPNNKLKARLQADLMSFGIYVGIPSPTGLQSAALLAYRTTVIRETDRQIDWNAWPP
jgi:hypothetical protein